MNPSVRSETMATETPSLAKSPGPWIYGPRIDLLVGCGAWSAPLLLLAYYASRSNASNRAWGVAFYFLALFFNYPHFMATIYRAYHTRTEFVKYRIFTVLVALLLVAAGTLAHLWYPLLPWIFTLYIFWSPWHYTGQNFGLLMMFARRSGLTPSLAERRALYWAFVASFLLLMLSFNTGTSGDALILSLGLSAKFSLPVRALLALFFVVSSSWSLRAWARRTSFRAVLPSLLLAVTQFLWFLLPAVIELVTGRDVPQTRYSSGILAVLHSTQYLWITSYYQAREARAAGQTTWSYWRYLVTLIAGGIALFIPGPWIVSRVFHVDFAASFLTFAALVNIHHFILDGALWKLRDSRIASFLLATPEDKVNAPGVPQNKFVAGVSWFAGEALGARLFRVGVVMALLAWGVMDQFHFYWSSKANDISALQRAAKLNPDDSNVQLHLARAESLAGEKSAALTALRHAARVNPANLSLQEGYARGLIEAGRDSDAYNQYQTILARWPRNTDALVNYGLLANRLGHSGEAVDNWERAVDVDPQQSNAQLYLAQALDQQGETQAAARHYRAYLENVAAHPKDHAGEKTTILVAYIKVADAEAGANHALQARQAYDAAIHFADKAGDAPLESLALIHLAGFQEKENDAATAVKEYQQALSLDQNLSDPRSAASDWVNYGQFLRRHGQPERLVFGCFLHAEDLLKATPGEELSAVVEAREESEKRLGREAAAARRSVESLSKEAISLPITAFGNLQ